MATLSKLSLLVLIIFLSAKLNAQLTALSGGLAFSSGLDYNSGTTGNPGLFGKAYIKIDDRFHVVPALTAFNRYKRSDFAQVLKNYMFHADIDGVVGLYKDRSLRFMALAGFNSTLLISKWDVLVENPNVILNNKTEIKPGLNLGGAFQLYVNDQFDGYISAKYIISSFDQLVINAGVIYYISGKRRRGLW